MLKMMEATQGHLDRGVLGARRMRRGTTEFRGAGSLRPLALAAVGVVLVGLSVGALLVVSPRGGAPARERQPAAVPPNVLGSVTTAELVYEPGHSSGWHVHPGLHAVVVLSGTLTVYDQACERQDYGPGQTYVGGRDPHVARNEHGGPVRIVATYVADGVTDRPGSAVGAPGGCEAVA